MFPTQLMQAATTVPDPATQMDKVQTLRTAMLRNQYLPQQMQQNVQAGAQQLQQGAQAIASGALDLRQKQRDQDDADRLHVLMYGSGLQQPPATGSPAIASPTPAAPAATGSPAIPQQPSATPAGMTSMSSLLGPGAVVPWDQMTPTAQTPVPPSMTAAASPATPAPATVAQAPQRPQINYGTPDTWDQLPGAMLRAGAQPKTVMNLQQMMTGMKQKAADLQKTQSEVEAANQKLQSDRDDYYASMAQNIKDTGYDPTATEWALSSAEAMHPEYAQNLDWMRQQIRNGTPIQSLIDPLLQGISAARQTSQARATTAATAAQKQANLDPLQKAQAAQATLTQNATQLSHASSPQEYQAMLDNMKVSDARPFMNVQFDPNDVPGSQQAIRNIGLNPMQATQTAQSATNAAETRRHNLSTESTERLNAAVNAGRLQQEQTINGMKYGPGTQEYWVQQLAQNPDSVKELPPELRSAVGQKFTAATGLPLPTPLSPTGQAQETDARNALDGVNIILNALKNPEIQQNIGPVLGRLGNAEQAYGSAYRLSPQAAQQAQQLRTAMRYFVFREGKVVLGGRLPQNLMQQLESSSANPTMDANMLTGALNGARMNAINVLNNNDKQRFGGKMRPPEWRGLPATQASPNPYRQGQPQQAAPVNPYR